MRTRIANVAEKACAMNLALTTGEDNEPQFLRQLRGRAYSAKPALFRNSRAFVTAGRVAHSDSCVASWFSEYRNAEIPLDTSPSLRKAISEIRR